MWKLSAQVSRDARRGLPDLGALGGTTPASEVLTAAMIVETSGQ